MWSYYGSKGNIAKYYPPPKCDTIIEPFAGAAKYSLRYFDRKVKLYDTYDRVIGIWKFLQQCSPEDIINLPVLEHGEDIRDFELSDEELNFMRFHIGVGLAEPIWKCSSMCRADKQRQSLKRISEQLHKIKHWEVVCGSYKDAPNQKATWFIDPPYQHGGHKYHKSNKSINYNCLRNYCLSRYGQVIVCENSKADWMSFVDIRENHGTFGTSTEVMYTNMVTSYGGGANEDEILTICCRYYENNLITI